MNLTVVIHPVDPELWVGQAGNELADFVLLAGHFMSLVLQSGLRFSGVVQTGWEPSQPACLPASEEP
jgi:hypothetical protein